MTYNLTLLHQSNTISGLFTTANSYTTGWLLGFLILAVFFIMLMALKKWEFDDALMASSFVCFVLAAILVSAELLNLLWAIGFLVVAAFTGLYMYITK